MIENILMLSISQCKKLLGKTDLTDKQVEDLRDALYAIIENILDEYYANMKGVCEE